MNYLTIKRLGIVDVVDHSDHLKPNIAYVAIKGARTNGADFISKAVDVGAKLIILDDAERYTRESALYEDRKNVEFMLVPDARMALNDLVKHFYPINQLNVKGVTGTNGKTSTAIFYVQLASILGFNSAAIGTLGTIECKAGETFLSSNFEPDLLKQNYPNGITTPDAIILRQQVSALAKSGYNNLIMELTSLGLDQKRVDHLNIDAIGFTNLTQDHLDYHGNFENYFKAKKRAFSELLLTGGTAVLNAEIPEFDSLVKACNERKADIKVLSYGIRRGNIRILHYKNKRLKISINDTKYDTLCNFPMTQIENLMCALGLGIASGFDVAKMIKAIPHLVLPIGRMERVAFYRNGEIFVDYAHTPDALETLLKSLRQELEKQSSKKKSVGRLGVVFGCGGQRDPIKRPIMGKIAQDLADFVIITDDNPRNEDPASIREQIAQGCNATKVRIIAERTEAIRHAINQMEEGDILVVAGKGCENHQIIGNQALYFSDTEEILKVLNKE